MNSKIFVLFLFVLMMFFSSCLERNPDAENNISILNATKDTVFYTEKFNATFRRYCRILPNELRTLDASYQISSLDIIKNSYQPQGRVIEINKLACPDCEGIEIREGWGKQLYYYVEKHPVISWSPPLLDLPDSVHSFYNINSWVITKGGRKNKWERAVFTITEDDLR